MPEETMPTPNAVRAYAAQDQKQANALAAARLLIETARDDAEIARILAARGYDAAGLAAGLSLQASAQAAFTARQTAMAGQQQASAALAGAAAAARQTYADFRATARAIFAAPADRTALGLTGNAPKDTQKFLTLARVSYTTAQAAAYQPTLTTYGYPATALTAAQATLDALSTANGVQNAAIGAARQATADRDRAVKALTDWVSQFKRIAKVALRDQPGLVKKLEL